MFKIPSFATRTPGIGRPMQLYKESCRMPEGVNTKKFYTWNKISRKTIKCCIFFHWHVVKLRITWFFAILAKFLNWFIYSLFHQKSFIILCIDTSRYDICIIILRENNQLTKNSYLQIKIPNSMLCNSIENKLKMFIIGNVK